MQRNRLKRCAIIEIEMDSSPVQTSRTFHPSEGTNPSGNVASRPFFLGKRLGFLCCCGTSVTAESVDVEEVSLMSASDRFLACCLSMATSLTIFLVFLWF